MPSVSAALSAKSWASPGLANDGRVLGVRRDPDSGDIDREEAPTVFPTNNADTGEIATLEKIEKVLVAAAGIEFIDENGGGPAVRHRKRQQAKQSKIE